MDGGTFARPIVAEAVDRGAIAAVWPHVAPKLRPAVEVPGALTSMQDVLARLLAGDLTLWLIHDGVTVMAAATGAVHERDRGRICTIYHLAGTDLEAWWDSAEAGIEQWARAQGCVAFEALVRPGLARRLRGRFTDMGHVIRRSIAHG